MVQDLDLPQGEEEAVPAVSTNRRKKQSKSAAKWEAMWVFAMAALATGPILSICGLLFRNPAGYRQLLVANVACLLLTVCLYLTKYISGQAQVKARKTFVVLVAIMLIVIVSASMVQGVNEIRRMPMGYTMATAVGIILVRAFVGMLSTQWGMPVAALTCFLIWRFGPLGDQQNPPQNSPEKNTDAVEFLLLLIEAPKWPLFVGAVLILGGVLILLAGGDHVTTANKLMGALISELGFAFFIAYVLAITIEMHAKLEHDRRISRGILAYIYGIELDNRMFFHTENHIFKSPFYRREAAVEYDFFCLDKEAGRVLVKQSLYYEVENISQLERNYEITTLIEKPDRTDLKNKLNRGERYGLNRLYIDGVLIEKNLIDEAILGYKRTPEYIGSCHRHILAPGESIRVKTVNITEKYIIDTELWRSLWPCDGITLHVRWHDDMDLEFHANPVHPSGDFDLFDQDTNSLTAAVHKPLFPHNGIHFWWRPRTVEFGALGQSPEDEAETSRRRRKLGKARSASTRNSGLKKWILRLTTRKSA